MQIIAVFQGKNSDKSFSPAIMIIPGVISLVGILLMLGVFKFSNRVYGIDKYKKINLSLLYGSVFILLASNFGLISAVFFLKQVHVSLSSSSARFPTTIPP